MQHEHQHNETMLQTLQLAEPGVFSPPEPPPATSGRRRPRIDRCRGGRSRDGAGRRVRLRQRARRRTRSSCRAFEIDRAPVTNGAFARVRRRRRLPRRELWDPTTAGRCAQREGWQRPLYWTADGGERRFDRIEPLDARPARDARLLVRGRRLRALGRRAAADRGRVGARRAARRATRAAGSTSATSAPARPARSSATAGSGPRGVRRLPRVRRRSPTPSTPRSSSAPATASCAAARGRPAAASRARRSATGTCPERRQIFAGFRLRGGRMNTVASALETVTHRPATATVRHSRRSPTTSATG